MPVPFTTRLLGLAFWKTPINSSRLKDDSQFSRHPLIHRQEKTLRMKCVLILALCVAAMAQRDRPEETQPPVTITVEELVWLEVGNIIRADTHINLSECKTRCDSHFSLNDALDESITDVLCQQECQLAVSGHEDFFRPPGERGDRPGRK